MYLVAGSGWLLWMNSCHLSPRREGKKQFALLNKIFWSSIRKEFLSSLLNTTIAFLEAASNSAQKRIPTLFLFTFLPPICMKLHMIPSHPLLSIFSLKKNEKLLCKTLVRWGVEWGTRDKTPILTFYERWLFWMEGSKTLRCPHCVVFSSHPCPWTYPYHTHDGLFWVHCNAHALQKTMKVMVWGSVEGIGAMEIFLNVHSQHLFFWGSYFVNACRCLCLGDCAEQRSLQDWTKLCS